MSENADPLVDALVNDFGANYVFALDLLEQYRRDRSSVDSSWGEYFDRLLGVEPAPRAMTVEAQPAPAQGQATSLVRSAPATPATRGRRRRPWSCPPSCPATSRSPSAAGPCASSRTWRRASPSPPRPRCAASRCARSRRTAASSTSTATRTGQSKVSFTHLVAWAILRALDTFPRLNDAYAELEGAAAPHPARPGPPRHRGRRAEEGRHAHAAGAQHQGRGHARLRGVPEGLRRPRGAARARARSRPTTSWARRSRSPTPAPSAPPPSAPAPDARPGPDRGHRRPRLPGRVPLDGAAHAVAARHQQGDDGDLHLRPPHHPGRGVGPLPGAAWRSCCGARTASTSGSSRT